MGRQIGDHIKEQEITLELNRLRSLKYLMLTPFFKKLYSVTAPELRKIADKAIQDKDPIALRKWIKDRQNDCLEGCSIRALQDMAKAQQINNYSRLSKVELIRKIQLVTAQGEDIQ